MTTPHAPNTPTITNEPDGNVYPSTQLPPPLLIHPLSPRTHLKRLQQRQSKLRVLILYSDTGGGHRASAAALTAALQQLFPADIHVICKDFWVELAAGPFTDFPNQYTFLARHPFLWKTTYEMTRFPPMRAVTETWFNTFGHKNVRKAFIDLAPDLIISVHPLINTLSLNVLRKLIKHTAIPPIPYVTVVTDLGGAHPTWFNSNADMTYVPSPDITNVAMRTGVASSKIRQFGLPVRQDFWHPAPEKEQLRQQLAMLPNIPAVLIIGGGDGIGGLKAVAETLATYLPGRLGGDNLQIVVICGKNGKLRDWLCSHTWPCNVIALGYVTNMSDWMAACDIICTKAGPGTIAEALIRGLPTILTAFLPGQEEANVKYVVNNGVGVYATKPENIAEKAYEWLSNPLLLSQISERAVALSRSQASLEIARDIMQVARDKIDENVALIEEKEVLAQQAQRLPTHLQEYIPMGDLCESTEHSLLLLRLRFMLRVVFGSMLASQALF